MEIYPLEGVKVRYPMGEYAFPRRFEGVSHEFGHGLSFAVLLVGEQFKLPCSGDDRPAATGDTKLLSDMLHASLR